MKLTLGTAQLGLPQYGRTNATGCPPEADAIALIHAAISALRQTHPYEEVAYSVIRTESV